MRQIQILFVISILGLVGIYSAFGDNLAFTPSGDIPDQQSTTGPEPPAIVLERDALKAQESPSAPMAEVTLPVPPYAWRHGCGPTAVGMVVGFYDGQGYDDLIPGDASTHTSQVSQAIASGGDSSNPNPPGAQEHYEDYAMPQDSWPTLLVDDYITQSRPAHTDNCIADYMDTSKSTRTNYYGWSWSNDISPAFVEYVNQQNPAYAPDTDQYHMPSSLTWSVLTTEIDNSRPMVFLVDSDGDGNTDHFVTVVGYRDTAGQQYGCLDTWPPYDTIRWCDFAQMANGQPWGIWDGCSFSLAEIVYFADANLKAAVEAQLGVTNPTANDMLNLTYLYAASSSIVDLTGLEYATNLTTLNLYSNQISDISALVALTNLRVLSLYYNQISDISALVGLTNLQTLDLHGNQISDIPTLAGLTNLRELLLSSNQISDISALAGLTNLTYLYLWLSNNQISNISALAELTNLRRLYLSDNPLNTVAYCSYIPTIESNNPGINLSYDTNPNPITNDCSTDVAELSGFALHWLEMNCDENNNWCGGADMDHINNVDIHDFAEFASYWLENSGP